MLTATLALAGLLAGLAGAWSPCGFSMVDTIAPAACGGHRVAAVGAGLAFAVGALAGGVATFGGMALAGEALGLAGGAAAAVAAGGLLAASAGDAAGRRLVPQIRRQVPESWRRILPLPVAAGLYGVLLGLGFTTFVLSFASYGLALAVLALADPAVGFAVGLAFGAGRALPVLVLAPLQESDAGVRAAAAMAERPAILLGLRVAVAAAMALAVAGLALQGAPARAAAGLFTTGSDPSAEGSALAYEDALGRGILIRDGHSDLLGGSDPAVGPGVVAWVEPGRIVVADLASLEMLAAVPATGVDAVAVNERYLAWRAAGQDGVDRLTVLDRLTPGAVPRDLVQTPAGSGALGPPTLDGTRMLFHLAGRSSRIVEIDLLTDARRELLRSRAALLLNPTARGNQLLYVRSTSQYQQLLLRTISNGLETVLYSIAPTGRRDESVEGKRRRHRAGYQNGRPPLSPRPAAGVTRTLWTTALAPDAAYVTVLRPTAATILRVSQTRR